MRVGLGDCLVSSKLSKSLKGLVSGIFVDVCEPRKVVLELPVWDIGDVNE